MTQATLEERLRELPETTSLPAGGEERFVSLRRRIGRRHRQWRANMPALDTLFDDDAHRAKALAGNAATEAQETLHAWADIEIDVAGVPSAERRRRVLEEMDRFLERWRRLSPGLIEAQDWDPVAREVFDDFLEELLTRARDAAEERLRGAGVDDRPRRLAWLRRPLRALARLWRRVFEPTGVD